MDRFRDMMRFRRHHHGGSGSFSARDMGPPFSTRGISSEMPQKAEIFRLEVDPTDKEKEEGMEKKYHTIVQLPTGMKRVDLLGTKYDMTDLTRKAKTDSLAWTFNLVMLDASGSMRPYWSTLCSEWNKYIAPKLDGTTSMYTFERRVHFIHQEPTMDNRSFTGGSTDLTGAVRRIRNLVRVCPYNHIRVFLVTDGQDCNHQSKTPNEILKKIIPNRSKRIDCYVLGIGDDFPVEISVTLRSKMHTGPNRCPTLFWAKDLKDIEQQVKAVGDEIHVGINIRTSMTPHLAPGLPDRRDEVYAGDVLYFESDPETVKKNLEMYCEDEPYVKPSSEWRKVADFQYSGYYDDDSDEERRYHMYYGRRDREMPHRHMFRDLPEEMMHDMDPEMMEEMCFHFGINPESLKKKRKKDGEGKKALLKMEGEIKDPSARFLMDSIFKQWSAIFLQRSKLGQRVDISAFDFMSNCFKRCLEKEFAKAPDIKDQSIEARLIRKGNRTLSVEFTEFVKEARDAVDLKKKFGNELDYAKTVLKSTVDSKYQNRVLQLKGYSGNNDWYNDMNTFMEEYKKLKPELQKLPAPSLDESCKIYMQSFLGDLQDTTIDKIMLKGKLVFLQEMTFSGIPIYAPIKDSVQMNPWTLYIKSICLNPFDILCQRVMEDALGTMNSYEVGKNKEVILKKDDPRAKFNVIVPIVPKEYAKLLKPLVTSTVFAVGCSFCILKNASIVDRSCHLAGLACVWMRTIREFPPNKRPEYIVNRIETIEANAKLYLDRKSIANYIQALFTRIELALTTSSEEKFNDIKIRCESLIKPCFLLHLAKDDTELLKEHGSKVPDILQKILMEFIGRCLSSYKSETPVVDFFLPAVDSTKREIWIEEKTQEIYEKLDLTGPNLLARHYDRKSLRQYMNTVVATEMTNMGRTLGWKKMLATKLPEPETDTYNYDSDENNSSDDDDDEIVRYEESMETEESQNRQEDGSGVDEDILMPNMAKIMKLSHSGSVGQLNWHDLRAWANEMQYSLNPKLPTREEIDEEMELDPKPICLTQDEVDYAFGVGMLTAYVMHALENRSNKDRISRSMNDPEDARFQVEYKIDTEWNRILKTELQPKIESKILCAWSEAFTECHRDLATPLTKEQIIEEASKLGVDVNSENFDQVYKYRPKSGLCRNCCQVRKCPHFLVPNRRFNCHIEQERRESGYPHTLHKTVAESRNHYDDVEKIVSSLESNQMKTDHYGKKPAYEQLKEFCQELIPVYSKFTPK